MKRSSLASLAWGLAPFVLTLITSSLILFFAGADPLQSHLRITCRIPLARRQRIEHLPRRADLQPLPPRFGR